MQYIVDKREYVCFITPCSSLCLVGSTGELAGIIELSPMINSIGSKSSFFICKSTKLDKFINEFDTAKIVNKCSVEICLDDSQYSFVGDGDSMQSSLFGLFAPETPLIIDDEEELTKFFFSSASSSKLIKLNEIAFGILGSFELAI